VSERERERKKERKRKRERERETKIEREREIDRQDQLHNGSTRLPTYKSISNQTGNTQSEEQEHEGSHPEQDSPKTSRHV